MHFSIYIMSALYIVAGINHFVMPKFYLRIMPAYIPWHKTLNILSGIAEILLGIALLFPVTRSLSAWGIMLLLILIFPANIEQVRTKKARMGLPLWVVWIRLPLQFALLYWAWLYT
jgi:uncharacterized membrane protein